MSETTARRGYAICTAPRSGSTHLGHLLRLSGVLGDPLEFFNTVSLRRQLDPLYPDDPAAQIEQILSRGATANGVYGVKVFAAHFDHAAPSGWAARLPDLSFVYLERRDVLAQAISLVRAQQTKAWFTGKAAEAAPRYDRSQITTSLVNIMREYTRWRFYFAVNGIDPLRLVYEDYVERPRDAIAAVAGLVGVEMPTGVDLEQAPTQVQRDDLSEAWRTRFLAESADLTVFH